MEFGLFNDGGCFEAGYSTQAAAENAREKFFAADPGMDDWQCEVDELCPDHEGERKGACPKCFEHQDAGAQHSVSTALQSRTTVVDAEIVQGVGETLGSLPHHAGLLNVQAALAALQPMRLAALYGDDSTACTQAWGAMVEPRSNGWVAAYWVARGQHRTADGRPFTTELEIMAMRFAKAGWTVLPNSSGYVTAGPQPDAVALQDRTPHAAAGTGHLTTEDVARRLADIHAVVQDDEVAHNLADDLYRDVLGAIAAGAPDAELLAGAALKVEDLDFGRWTA
jgi:hypothetical protein